MYKPKIAIKTSFSFNLPYFESKQERIYHIKKKPAHLLNQAAIRHTSSNNWYNIFIIHLFTLSQTFWKQFCWSTSLISDCWFLVVIPTFTVRSFAAGTREPIQKGWVVPSVQPWSTYSESCPNAWNPNSTVSPSTTRWPQPDAHFNQLLHQRSWNLIHLFSDTYRHTGQKMVGGKGQLWAAPPAAYTWFSTNSL